MPGDPGLIPGSTTLDPPTASNVIETLIGDEDTFHIKFHNDWLKKQGVDRLVYSRGKVVDNLAFVQYWMFYPSSTPGTDIANEDEVYIYHEGDWEMMQVTVRLNETTESLSLEGATASQHYRGQTLSWSEIQSVNKYKPVIYIAGGSHATYFTAGGFKYTAVTKDYTNNPKENPEQCTLEPFDMSWDVGWWLWNGHWGAYDITPDTARLFFGAVWMPEINSGPPSPKNTEREGIRIFDQPGDFSIQFLE